MVKNFDDLNYLVRYNSIHKLQLLLTTNREL